MIIGRKVELKTGETGVISRVFELGPVPEPLYYVVTLDKRRSNGDGVDVVTEADLHHPLGVNGPLQGFSLVQGRAFSRKSEGEVKEGRNHD